jgi:Flp pilus assembly protein TadG
MREFNMHRQHDQEGYVMVTVAVVLVVFLGFTALSIDVGMLYSARASAQKAADAAALAGAFVFITNPNLSETTTPKLSDMIKAKAVTAAATNKILGDTVSISTSDVTVDVANRRVTVQVTKNQGTLFARAIGENSANISTTAVAEAALNATGDKCTKPVFAPNTVLSTQPPCSACSSNEVVISGGQVTDYAKTRLGTRIQLKPNSADQALAPGQFYAIQLPGDPDQNGSGGSPGTESPVACNDFYPLKTGAMVGPTNQGFEELINKPNQDTYVAIGQYRRTNGTISSTSPSLCIVPIWDLCGMAGFCPDADFPQGSNQQVQVIGFALIFVEGKCNPDVAGCGPPQFDPNSIVARLVGVTACSGGGGGGGSEINPDETGPFSLPIRLVRTS